MIVVELQVAPGAWISAQTHRIPEGITIRNPSCDTDRVIDETHEVIGLRRIEGWDVAVFLAEITDKSLVDGIIQVRTPGLGSKHSHR